MMRLRLLALMLCFGMGVFTPTFAAVSNPKQPNAAVVQGPDPTGNLGYPFATVPATGSTWTVSPGIVTGTLSAWTSATALNTTQTIYTTSGVSSVLVHLVQTSTLSAGAVTFEITYDNSHWITVSADCVIDPTSTTLATISLPYTLQASTNKGFLILSKGSQGLRIKLSTQITGAGSVTPNYALLAYNAVTQTTAVQSGTWTVQPGNTQNTTPWKVDGSGVTQPVSGTVTANAGSGTFTVGGTVTANAGTGTFTVDGSGHTQPVSAVALPLPTGAATETTLAKVPLAQGSTTSGQNGALIQGAVTTAAPSYTTAQTSPLSLNTAGGLRVDGSGATQPVSGTVTANAGSGTFAVSGTVTANAGSGTFTVDGSGHTQPISASALPLPSGATTETTLAAQSAKFPTAAAAADTTANPTISGIGSFPYTYNGTTWDRWRDVNAANAGGFSGIGAVGPMFLDTGTATMRRGVTAASTTSSITGIQVPASGVLGYDGSVFRPIGVDTSGRTQVVGAAAAGTALAGNPVRIGISDGTNVQDWKQLVGTSAPYTTAGVPLVAIGLSNGSTTVVNWHQASATGDNTNGSQSGAVGGYVYNNASWDRIRGTVNASIRASATGLVASTVNTDITTYNAAAFMYHANVSNYNGGTLTVSLQWKDANGQFVTIPGATTGGLTSGADVILAVGPSAWPANTATAFYVNYHLPRLIRVVETVATATVTLGAAYELTAN